MLSDDAKKEQIKYKATFCNNCSIASLVAAVAWFFAHLTELEQHFSFAPLLPVMIYLAGAILLFDMAQDILGDL